MTDIPLTLSAGLAQARVRELFRYNRRTGLLTWRVARGRVPAGRVVSTKKDGYIIVGIDGVLYRAHRVIWLHVTGEWPENGIDHRNRKRGDNRWRNLREATQGQNMQNFSRPELSKCGFRGVSLNGKGFKARVKVNYRHVNLGTFPTAEEAHAAYLAGKARLHTFHPTA